MGFFCYTAYRILQYYYGNDIDIVFDAPTGPVVPSFPGRLLRRGSAGESVRTLQRMLRRISQNFPAIPAPTVNTGVFDAQTEAAVRAFQRTFGLTPDGVVGQLTWNRAVSIFNAVKRLNELDSEGVRASDIAALYGSNLRLGDRGFDVRAVQYMLDFIATTHPSIVRVFVDGIFGPLTDRAVRAFQQDYGLTPDGIVGRATYNKMLEAYDEVYASLPADETQFAYPNYAFSQGDSGQKVLALQTMLAALARHIPGLPALTPDGDYGSATTKAVTAFQRYAQLPVSGDTGILTWNGILDLYQYYEDGGA